MNRTVLKRGVIAAFSAVTLLSGSVVVAPAAQAAHDDPDGRCETGEFCLYYNSNNQGSLRDFRSNVWTYGTGSDCIEYIGPGNGKGQCVKNNAASAWNRRDAPVTVFYKSGWKGAIDNFTSGAQANLRSELKNDNASHIFGIEGRTRLEVGIYHTASARITSYFDGYLNTPGRHEGIDLAWFDGAGVYSPKSGEVINRIDGKPGSTQGSGALSTLAIYNSSLNKTFVYLHIHPHVSEGDYISAGEFIGHEDNRGASASHTHVEVRSGRETRAAKSYNDYNLENDNPTQWWMSHGYNICCQFT